MIIKERLSNICKSYKHLHYGDVFCFVPRAGIYDDDTDSVLRVRGVGGYLDLVNLVWTDTHCNGEIRDRGVIVFPDATLDPGAPRND